MAAVLRALRLVSLPVPQEAEVFAQGAVAGRQPLGRLSAIQSQMRVQRRLRYQLLRFQKALQKLLAQG